MIVRIEKYGLQVATELVTFIEDQALPGTGVSQETFWSGLSRLAHDYGSRNRELLETREAFQQKLDAWHVAARGQAHDADAYQIFLEEIGYLKKEGPDFSIDTINVDPEIANIPGPQLVVPITNARFALNAANARWGNLYDALYGTDALGELPKRGEYDEDRGRTVIAWAKSFLDQAVPLDGVRWSDVTGIEVAETLSLIVDGAAVGLKNAGQYLGHMSGEGWQSVLLENNFLKIEILINPKVGPGRTDLANIAAVNLEAAVSVIMDCEDSVACVDAQDKVAAYTNWLGLMKGDLHEEVIKGDVAFTRKLFDDALYTAPDGTTFTVKRRSLMLVRNVGHLMTNTAVIDRDGFEIGEGLMDALITVLIAMHDLARDGGNSLHGSVYVVKPKMHGPDEVMFANDVFSCVEDILCLPRNTVKLGIMDEERRTSANLKECIRAAKSRVAFINTGFLDRTGDEIHSSMEAGPFLCKGDMKTTPWIESYEDRNVDIGLACGLQGKAQIGKGMWAMPDLMHAMLEQKIGHPRSGANCAWVPSPTAATLHATHYHRVNVLERQAEIKAAGARGELDDLLTIPLLNGANLSDEVISREIENNAQGILGYVVRWVDQGVGCSKVPDINDVALMEDRATCRISSQALANWLHHGVVSEARVMQAMRKMAAVVDRQNKGDQLYKPMAPDFDGIAFQAACDLVFRGRMQPSGYTEPVLHARRLELKSTL
ncbi:malate synthase G [Pseudopelagicola sp. nBUS_19]|uniref:malate synthase G n=1 Tax=Pseudopelagicola sp. nBUS_19 TaxID=3395316 RepID=UPI003EB7939E